MLFFRNYNNFHWAGTKYQNWFLSWLCHQLKRWPVYLQLLSGTKFYYLSNRFKNKLRKCVSKVEKISVKISFISPSSVLSLILLFRIVVLFQSSKYGFKLYYAVVWEVKWCNSAITLFILMSNCFLYVGSRFSSRW